MPTTCVSCRSNPCHCVPTTSTSDSPSANNASKNTHNGLFAPRACYILHGVLVVIHIVLVIFYVYHWEHCVTFSFTSTNNDFWPTVLSASLQAFYTIYTAVLLFLTQRLAISRTLVHGVKLTAVHDISGAWAGFGSAISSIWRQTEVPASWWATSAVAAYLASITVLHVTSSTLLQFQTFNASITTQVPTTLGWPNDLLYNDTLTLELQTITPSLQLINQLTGLVSAGLSNTTLYDTSEISDIAGHATVNATMVTSSCALIPNVTYSANTNKVILPSGPDSFVLHASTLGPDQIHIIPWEEFNQTSGPSVWEINGICLMVSTLLEIDPSVQDEVAVNITRSVESDTIDYVNQVYFIQCSLSANTTDAEVDMQTNNLLSPTPISQPSTQWKINQIELSKNWQAQIGGALATDDSSEITSSITPSQFTKLSITDEYIMSLVDLSTQTYLKYQLDQPPTFTLRLDKLEFAVAKAAAQLIWLATQKGQIGAEIHTGIGKAYVNGMFIALRLSINFLPLVFAASASVIMLGLALDMTRAFDASHDRQAQAAIQNIGVLQLLWLGHRTASVNKVLKGVQDSTEANLRRAGMEVDVCFMKTISDEEESGSSTDSDSLFCDDDHCCDDEK
ncbi:hypothetical protein C8R48DRAFT_392675 [Suillus tomentosus]|nr:hypothetical protein C8R48DRAFT_392675 [Suillus tomentosus]